MIELNHISKEFHGVTALKQVTASIEKGHVFGLIGSNGAGKSTLLRILCGILSPDEGTVTVDGQPVYENLPSREISFLSLTISIFLPMPPRRK